MRWGKFLREKVPCLAPMLVGKTILLKNWV